MKRRGQFLSLLTVFTLVFIGSGHIFTELTQGSMITGDADRAIGDPEKVAETKVYTEIYKKRVPLMINYSMVNASESLADEYGSISLDDGIPTDSGNYTELLSTANENLTSRNVVNSYQCGEITLPELEIVDASSGNITVSTNGDDFVKCTSSDINVNIDHGFSDPFNVSYNVGKLESVYP